MNDFVSWCDYLGTFAFAISGIRLAAAKGFDWFGAYVVGMVTATGGGTLRDILINVPPFWLIQPSYLVITALALVFTIVLRHYVVRATHSLFFFDTVGLGLFVVVGLAKTVEAGFPWWVALVMGTITGSFGGMLRDILINEVPLIFRKDFYALPCFLGGVVYVGLSLTSFSAPLVQLFSALSVVGLRILAVIFHFRVPTFDALEEDTLT
ncbi:MAG: trimeric intracellular cation channel family protein [Porphyromonadaceae bacterium]|nr:trimeric intracellular cation channel family protein [Porphyromonadaceae bacterium]